MRGFIPFEVRRKERLLVSGDTRLQTGFTLIEILVVIGIIAVLASIVIIAINPARQFAQARNTQRQANVESILNAIGQHIADNKGVFLGGTPACPALPSPTASTHILNGAGVGIDLSCLTPTYIPFFPTDPNIAYAVAPYTGYDVSVDAVGRITVCASQAAAAVETALPGAIAICVTR